MTRCCRQCRIGRHDYCTGLGCFCRETPRCDANADLSEGRISSTLDAERGDA